MIQQYIPYWEWEDWINGMWRSLQPDEVNAMLQKCIEFTGNHIIYGEAMLAVSFAWPRTMLNSLTNTSINPRAFIGHCACCYTFGCPEYITRMAWKELTDQQRFDADAIAQKHVDEWRRKYNSTFEIGNKNAIAKGCRTKDRKTYSIKYRPISESLLQF